MRYSAALLLLMVFNPPLSAQALPMAQSLQSAFEPAPLQNGLVLRPVDSSSLQAEAILALPLPQSVRGSSLGRHLGWGALLGASAGVLSSLMVLLLCEEYCEGSRSAGVGLHVSAGAVGGAGAGAILYHLRR